MSAIAQVLLGGTGIVFPTNPAAGSLGWYKPENIQQSVGVTTSWTDAGSLGQNLSANNAPLYNSSARNGLAGVSFNGINQNLSHGNSMSDWIPAAGFNCFGVVNLTATPGTDGGPWGSATTLCPTITYPSSTTARGEAFEGSQRNTGTLAVALSTFYIAHLHYDGTNLGMRINGSESSTVAMGLYTGQGNIFRVGVNNGNYITGTICELLFYGSMTAPDITTTLQYLQGRYNLTP